MKTFYQPGGVLDVTANRTALSGAGMKIGNIFGVLVADATNAAAAQLITEGVVTIAKLSTAVLAVGDTVYWDNTNFRVDATATAQLEVGQVVEAAGNGTTTVKVKLIPTVRASSAA